MPQKQEAKQEVKKESGKTQNLENKQSNKFSEEEMKELRQVQQKYISLQGEFGQLGVTKIRLTQQLDNLSTFEDELVNKFKETQEQEKKFISSITEKYGEGQLDAESGVFTKT